MHGLVRISENKFVDLSEWLGCAPLLRDGIFVCKIGRCKLRHPRRLKSNLFPFLSLIPKLGYSRSTIDLSAICQYKTHHWCLRKNMEIRAKEAEALFAAAYGIGAEHRVAFRRRLEHLRTYGCPSGLATGRGRPAIYNWLQLVQQTIALDLIDVGLTPERAARLAVGDLHGVKMFAAMLTTLMADSAALAAIWIDEDKWPSEHSLFLYGRLRELASVSDPKVPSETTFSAICGNEIAKWNAERASIETVGIIIDFGQLIASLIKRVANFTEQSTIDATKSFYEWAENYELHS